MKIVIGGQVEKKEIESLIKEIDSSMTTMIKSDLEAAMAVKTKQADYYVGACHTGGGGALAMAIALLGKQNCETVSMPGKKPNAKQIENAVNDGKIAFGFTADHKEMAIPLIMNALKNKS